MMLTTVAVDTADMGMTPSYPRGMRTALLLVDLQEGTCGSHAAGNRPALQEHFLAFTLPRLERALALSRAAGVEVIHTVIADLTADGRDRSADYRRCGMGFPPGSPPTRVIAPLAPRPDELVLPKSSSSPFSSTTLDYLLRNMAIEVLVVAGMLTDQCIDHTVKDAADRGYRVICLHDACLAESRERHRAALACFRGYGEQLSVEAYDRWLQAQPPLTR